MKHNNHLDHYPQINKKINGLNSQIAKENQEKFLLLMIQEKMLAKRLAKEDQMKIIQNKNITHGSMVMAQNSISYIMNYLHMITGKIKIL
jgi:hypothetical protein